ncbi:Eaf7p SKDI_14G1890 [Saccharomyces kudriavzevii IFO 1802]|uniref:Chromatin modification-related protein EAF7 n=2 Tax=Saccharomyces kudriavzevii (strain ATCC MYA-4449 / AS 2.2408 / CBS 8840 / NBRC 1802 / NCYC 2889) TaxID=226230 RepID=J6EDZ1_SACK1|nr:uncharacterized protein SKDI_14G1890 [Saccharomyces kudriavzevii IFO 1802]EJT41867.1 EAF7-like protein [Saccharomyces kudriavzevii IFO 1802]CAI4049856.1 hypothetical protein SKDI_14G1890 [Saccharomyces kudriavzevii IFO 1802]
MAIHWTIVDEIRLLRWASEFKPAGIHKHFHMFCIVERMNSPDKYPVTLLQKETMKLGKIFTAKDIWEKLGQSYNLENIDKMENAYSMAATTECSLNDDDEEIHEETLLELNNRMRARKQDFTLPWDEYGELILEHAKKGPASIEEEAQAKYANDRDNDIPKKVFEDQVEKTNHEEEKDVVVAEKGEGLNEHHAKVNDTPSDSQYKLKIETQGSKKEDKMEHTSDEEQKIKTESKTAAPVRKSQRLRRNKEVKFEDEGEEDTEHKETGEEEQNMEEPKEQEGETQEQDEENDEESNEKEEVNDEREKSSSYENTNGSESEEVDEALEYESENEKEDTERGSGPEMDNLKKKMENKKEENQQDGARKDSKVQNEPLAKRTRHSSSAGNTSNEASPKRKRRKASSRKDSTPATRVSSRLRNKR